MSKISVLVLLDHFTLITISTQEYSLCILPATMDVIVGSIKPLSKLDITMTKPISLAHKNFDSLKYSTIFKLHFLMHIFLNTQSYRLKSNSAIEATLCKILVQINTL